MTNTFTYMKWFCALIVCWGLTITSSYAQQWEEMKNKGVRFSTIQETIEEYYKGRDKGQGSGYKHFKRWEYENQFNVDEYGNWVSEDQVYEEITKFKKNYRQSKGLRLAPGADPQVLAAGNSNWTELGPKTINPTSSWAPGYGRIKAIAVNPKNNNEIYVVSPGGGCWKSTVGGNSWTPLTDNLPVYSFWSVAIDPVNTAVVYIGSERGGIFKSTNSGALWTPATSGVPSGAITRKIIIDPSNTSILIAATSSGIYRSVNGGASWSLTRSGNYEDVEFKPGNSSVVYACDSKVYRSTNNGQSFVAVSGIIGTGRTMLAVTPANPGYVYAVQSNGNIFGYLYRSTDSGISFGVRVTGNTSGRNYFGYNTNGVDTRGQAWHDMAIAVSPSNSEEVHIGGIITWKSTNGGLSFVATTAWSIPNSIGYTHCDMHALEYVGNTLYTGSDGGIYKSTDAAENFTTLSNGLGIRMFYKIGCARSNASMVTGGAQDNGSSLWKGTGWVDWLGADGMEGMIDHFNPNIVYGTSQNGTLYKSTNGGSSRTNLPTPPGSGDWVTPWVMDPNNSQISYVGYQEIHKSSNGGSSWTQISNFGTSGGFDNIAIAPSNAGYIYASKGSTLYRTTNGGGSWTNITAGLSGNINYITVHNSNPGKIAVATNSSGKVYVSSNAGVNWISIARNLPNITPKSIVYENGTNEGLYVGMMSGVYYTNRNMTQWIPFMDNLPNVEIGELEIHYGSNKIRAGTYGRGLWESPLYNGTIVTNPPVVSITSPSSGASFTAPASITFSANATDSDGSVTRVEFYSGSTKIGEDLTSPYSFTWSGVTKGTYFITAKATDNSGLSTTSSAISITVNDPIITTQSPYGGTAWPIPGKIEAENYDEGGEGVAYHDIEATNLGGQYRVNNGVDIETSTDAGGGYNLGFVRTGEWVEYTVNVQTTGTYKMDLRIASAVSGKTFRIDMNGTNIGGIINVPNTGGWQNWQTITVNSISLTQGVKVMRVVGLSDDVNINHVTFSTTMAVAPVVSITSPASGTLYSAPANISISASASDADGSIMKVEFYSGSTKLGEDAIMPYTLLWSGAGAGTYSLTAKATDNNGNTTTSSIVTVTVNEPTTQTPYGGTPWSIPGKIEAENYDNGGEGIAYHELETANQGGKYRTNEAVDIETCADAGGGYNMGFMRIGEWVEYTVNVQVSNAYRMDLRLATGVSGKTFRIEMNGATIGGVIDVPNTGGWQNWTTVSITNIALTQGVQVMRVVVLSDDINFNHITFETQTVSNTPPLVSITSPSSRSSFNAPATININALASDNDGTVSKVEFFNGAVKIGEALASPYNFTWSNVAAGSYSITARAFDNNGSTGNSQSVTITVNAADLCSSTVQYVENGGYVGGSIVKNSDSRYECRPWPNSGWCNGAAWAYAPGTGAYWSDAWILIGACSSTPDAMPAVNSTNSFDGMISIAPNPTEGADEIELTIQAANAGEEKLSMISSSGMIIQTGMVKVNAGDNAIKVNVAGLSKGVYVIKIGVYTSKFIKD